MGSGSPRRRQLLEMMEIPFEVISLKDVDESFGDDVDVMHVPKILSKRKSLAYTDLLEKDDILITADTVVIHRDKILGKPIDIVDAADMLDELSGDVHKVVTGVTITGYGGNGITFSETTEVLFNDLSRDVIEGYVARHRPLDKAGAYGIQEWIGAVGVKSINGCFYNVMGLPTSRLYYQLNRFIDSEH